jgi:hypothetical protein
MSARVIDLPGCVTTAGPGTTVGAAFSPGIVLTTTETMQDAKELASRLVKAKLAACVQMKEVVSAFIWDGEFSESPEVRFPLFSSVSVA